MSWLWRWAVLWLLCVPVVARAQGLDALGALKDEVKSEQEEADAAQQARLDKLHAMQSRKGARVVVLPWPDGGVDEDHVLFQTLVRNQIGRPDAKFFPAYDLYQEGRRRWTGGSGAPPTAQTGRVPPELLTQLRAQADRLRSQLGASTDNPTVAEQGVALVHELWFVDGPESRALLFDLYATIAQAVYGRREQTPPFYRVVASNQLSYYAYLAAALLWEEKQLGQRELAQRLPGGPAGAQIADWVEFIEAGMPPLIPVGFVEGGLFDAERFAREFTVMINGLEWVVPDSGVINMPRGRLFISLERKNGFGLSERVEIQRLDDKMYLVLDTARAKMGHDLLFKLMDGPPVCAPPLTDDVRANLATYAALHPKEEIYVAIPKAGSPYDPWVWLWDRRAGELKLVLDPNRGFPVRFVALAGFGPTFSGASINTEAAAGVAEPSSLQNPGAALAAATANPFELQAAGLPIDFQLRGHFNRLMFGVGVQWSPSLSKDAGNMWTDLYQVDGGLGHVAYDTTPDEDLLEGGGELAVALKQRAWSRLTYGLLGVMLGKNATYGIGPRAYVRGGTMNLPHAVELSGHIGATEDPSMGKKPPKGRVAALIDFDLYAGVLIPYGDTIFTTDTCRGGTWTTSGCSPRIMPNLGINLGAGFSF